MSEKDINKDKKNYTKNLKEVINRELAEISKRRKRNNLDNSAVVNEKKRLEKEFSLNSKINRKDKSAKVPGDREYFTDVRTGLFGLSFSGGGIRSATFNLGMLQSLAKKGILRFVDYLSTVSGGGYIGSCLSSLLTNKDAGVQWNKNFPFYFNRNEKSEERIEVKHLRRYSNYLLPGNDSFLNICRMIGSYITGFILTNIVTAALFILIAFAANFLAGFVNVTGNFPFDFFPVYFLYAGAFFLSLTVIIRLFSSIKSREPDIKIRSSIEFINGILLGLAVLSVIMGSLILLTYFIPIINELNKTAFNLIFHGITITSMLGLFTGMKKIKGEVIKAVFGISMIIFLPLLLAEVLYLFIEIKIFSYSIIIFNSPVSVMLLIAIGLLILSCFIKTNRISMHGFYRDKLSKAYMICCDDDGRRLKSNDRCRLTQMHNNDNGPYHIINATLNIPRTGNTYFRGRKSDLFIFSKLFCGSMATGYKETGEYYRNKLTLTTAMAVSGAALSPQMGMLTNPALSFFLTLFNVRLNRWLPNPGSGMLKEFFFIQPYYFLKELFCQGSEKDWHVNVSDGGHFENSGLYSLIQRRCRYIVVSDAGEDIDHMVKDLAVTIRRIRVDMGVDISMDFTGIRPDEKTGYTPLHHAVGRIIYPCSEEDSYIVYIKTLITGDEPEDILSYKRQNPAFPDQTTIDQFFDEAQFESYRKLGEVSGKAVFKYDDDKKNTLNTKKSGYSDKDLLAYFRRLLDDYEKECERIRRNRGK